MSTAMPLSSLGCKISSALNAASDNMVKLALIAESRPEEERTGNIDIFGLKMEMEIKQKDKVRSKKRKRRAKGKKMVNRVICTIDRKNDHSEYISRGDVCQKKGNGRRT